MRLFIAIEFSETEKAALMQSAEVLRASCARGNFSLRENYHLTLRFLGEVPPAKVKRITAAMDECRAAAFDVTVGRLGRFRRDGGDIFWREVTAPRALADLQRELSQKLAAAEALQWDYVIERKDKQVQLTEYGAEKAERYFGIDNVADVAHSTLNDHIQQALKAHHLFHLNEESCRYLC